jgi:ABC-type antimicrobial peptide transport system permease subunit
VGIFHGNLPQVANTRSQVTIVKQDFNNNTLPPLPRYDNKTAHIVTKSILVTEVHNMWEVSMGGFHRLKSLQAFQSYALIYIHTHTYTHTSIFIDMDNLHKFTSGRKLRKDLRLLVHNLLQKL